jgi:hypothetical protein
MNKYIIIILLLFICSCKKEESKTIVEQSSISSATDSIIYSSKSLESHLQFNKEFGEYEFVKLINSKSFTEAELNYSIKENEFEFNKTSDFKYYTPFTFDFDRVSYNLIAYHSYGENDSKVANAQLNSYIEGKQVDAILLDSRFTAETEYYREFTLTKNGMITIKKVAINGLNYNNAGDIIGQKKLKDSTAETVQYKMNTNGIFTKV